jgi:hypothetical protein
MARSELDVTCSAQVLSFATGRREDAQGERSRWAWIEDKVETEALNATSYMFKYYYALRLLVLCCIVLASHDIALCHLLWPNVYISHNTTHTIHNNTMRIIHTRHDHTINSNMVLVRHSIPVRNIQCMHITYKQYCQIYVHIIRVPVIVTSGLTKFSVALLSTKARSLACFTAVCGRVGIRKYLILGRYTSQLNTA